jgi:hypothetical protein
MKVKGQEYTTEIVDTAGQDEYSIMQSKHFIGIHGYMLVYSVGSKQSFEMIRVIRDKILNHLVSHHISLSTLPTGRHNGLPNNDLASWLIKWLSIEPKSLKWDSAMRFNERRPDLSTSATLISI